MSQAEVFLDVNQILDNKNGGGTLWANVFGKQ